MGTEDFPGAVRVGDLSSATGLTVRALHHYEEIGLLAPAKSPVARGGDVVYPPIDQPYGDREYSARDCEGALWSFMKAIE